MERRWLLVGALVGALLSVPGVADADAIAISSAGVSRSGRLCVNLNGSPGDVAVVNLTPVNATAAGNGQLISSDTATPPQASNVNFAPGTVDPNVATATIGTNGQVCYANSTHATVDIIADHLATIHADAVTTDVTGAPQRVLDTRVTSPVTASLCSTSGRCIAAVDAVGTGHTYAFLLSDDGGTTWRHSSTAFTDQRAGLFGGFSATSMACTTETVCEARSETQFFSPAAGSGTAYWRTGDGGRTWQRQFVQSGGLPETRHGAGPNPPKGPDPTPIVRHLRGSVRCRCAGRGARGGTWDRRTGARTTSHA